MSDSSNDAAFLQHELDDMREQYARLESVISELAVPVVPLLDGVIVLPLVGTIDTRRAQQVIESYIGQAIRAASLLGAHVVLSGIGARIAQTLVALDIDFSSVTTCANLRDGIETALAFKGMRIVEA
jgi:rsbT co-antagonist protein RsbR